MEETNKTEANREKSGKIINNSADMKDGGPACNVDKWNKLLRVINKRKKMAVEKGNRTISIII